MTVQTQGASGVQHAQQPGNLADVVEILLDKGLVIDAYVRVSLVGIELLSIEARIVVASIDTYLRYAREVQRLGLESGDQTEGLPGMLGRVRSSDSDGEPR